MESCDLVSTPMKIKDKLDLDQNGTLVDATKYHSMIGALMYLTSSRPNIVHATCLCARYQAKPTEKHLKEVKRIFRYLRGTANTAIAISYNPVQHSRTKHIAVRYHFIKEHVEKGTIEQYFVKTDYQLVDLFTKALPADRFNYLEELFGISEKLNVSQMISQDTLIDFYQTVLLICMAIHQRPTNCCFSRSYKAVKVRTFRVILFSIHSDEWKSFQSQHQTTLRIRRWRYNLIPMESRFKTSCSIIKDKYMMKAQVKENKEKNKIRTKPDENRERGKAQKCRRPIKVKKAEENTKSRDQYWQFLEAVLIQVIQICLWCIDSGCSRHMTGNLKLLINFIWKFMRTVHFGNDHVAGILGFGDLQWVNILITRVYFVEGLGHNLFSVGQFCDSDLEVVFRRDACFVRNLKGVDLLKGDRLTNLYTINLYEMASASPICLMACASSTKSWLWHQRLSHLNFDTINDLARNDLVAGLPKFKYHKEHLCPSCEQGKSKRASHPPKPVPNLRQRLHLLHMDLCGPIRIASINGKQYVLVIVDDYSRYTWVHFLRSKDEAPEVIIKFLKRITVLLHALCYPKNDRKDIGKLGAKGDIGFFIGYSRTSMMKNKPKYVKEAMTDPAWIESMQEELLQFKRMDIWVLVPAPDNISPLTLK
nr:retrovirus-related Pol polyprotein from transposon TNT 1-94 [Tanacetum cinerariifolium]